jgi:hypothetical protein
MSEYWLENDELSFIVPVWIGGEIGEITVTPWLCRSSKVYVAFVKIAVVHSDFAKTTVIRNCQSNFDMHTFSTEEIHISTIMSMIL